MHRGPYSPDVFWPFPFQEKTRLAEADAGLPQVLGFIAQCNALAVADGL